MQDLILKIAPFLFIGLTSLSCSDSKQSSGPSRDSTRGSEVKLAKSYQNTMSISEAENAWKNIKEKTSKFFIDEMPATPCDDSISMKVGTPYMGLTKPFGSFLQALDDQHLNYRTQDGSYKVVTTDDPAHFAVNVEMTLDKKAETVNGFDLPAVLDHRVIKLGGNSKFLFAEVSVQIKKDDLDNTYSHALEYEISSQKISMEDGFKGVMDSINSTAKSNSVIDFLQKKVSFEEKGEAPNAKIDYTADYQLVDRSIVGHQKSELTGSGNPMMVYGSTDKALDIRFGEGSFGHLCIE